MRFTSLFTTVFCAVLSASPSLVKANTPLEDAIVQNSLSTNNGFDIAWASRPLWHFGKSRGNKPCYPSAALDANGQPHGVEPNKWPNASQGCPDPGDFGDKSNPFPTYFTVSKCSDDELRVAYHLYFKKDGFSDVLIAKGHKHDWERIIVTWRRNTADGNRWTRTHLLKSFHSGYMDDSWGGIQNTFDETNLSEQGGKNKDHAKIYVGWAKHAMFSQRNTGYNDKVSQGCGREFRSNDWWYMPKKEDMIAGWNGTPEGERMKAVNWGSANSGPWAVEGRICGVKKGGYTTC